MAEVAGWVWERNVRLALEYVSSWTGYDFDSSDWGAVDIALPETDADDPDGWFEYPIGGQPAVRAWLARNPGAAPISIRLFGDLDSELVIRIQTLLALLSDNRINASEAID